MWFLLACQTSQQDPPRLPLPPPVEEPRAERFVPRAQLPAPAPARMPDDGWPVYSTAAPPDLDRVVLSLDAGGRDVQDPVWVCVDASVDGMPVALPTPARVSFFGGPEVEVTGGCVGVPAPRWGEAQIVAKWGAATAHIPVRVVGAWPLVKLGGPGDQRVIDAISQLNSLRLDRERNARFVLQLTEDATVGALNDLLARHDAAIMSATELGGRPMLSIAVRSESVEIEALVATAASMESSFVELAVPDVSIPLADLATLSDPPRTQPTGTPSFAGPYPEYVPDPMAVAVSDARVLVVREGKSVQIPLDKVVRILRRSHDRVGPLVIPRTEMLSVPMLSLPPFERAALRAAGIDGAVRIWPQPGAEALTDLKLLSISEPAPAPIACDGMEITEFSRLCVSAAERIGAGEKRAIARGTELVLTAEPDTCLSSSGTIQSFSELVRRPGARDFSGRICVRSTGFGMVTADCGGAGNVSAALTVDDPSETIRLGRLSLTLPPSLSEEPWCTDSQRQSVRSPPEPKVRSSVLSRTAIPIELDAEDGRRYLLMPGELISVPVGVYRMYADLGAGSVFVGVHSTEHRQPITCDPRQCRCSAALAPSDGPAGTCAPIAAPPRLEAAAIIEDPVRGPWSLVERKTVAAMPGGRVRCTIVRTAVAGALGPPEVRGCKAPFASWAAAWAADPKNEIPAADGTPRTEVALEWLAREVPEWQLRDRLTPEMLPTTPVEEPSIRGPWIVASEEEAASFRGTTIRCLVRHRWGQGPVVSGCGRWFNEVALEVVDLRPPAQGEERQTEVIWDLEEYPAALLRGTAQLVSTGLPAPSAPGSASEPSASLPLRARQRPLVLPDELREVTFYPFICSWDIELNDDGRPWRSSTWNCPDAVDKANRAVFRDDLVWAPGTERVTLNVRFEPGKATGSYLPPGARIWSKPVQRDR